MKKGTAFNANYDKPWIIKSSVVIFLCIWGLVAFLLWVLRDNIQMGLLKYLLCIGGVLYMLVIGLTRLLQVTRKYPCLELDETGLIYDSVPLHCREYFKWEDIHSMEFYNESSWRTIKVIAYSAKKKKVIAFTISLSILAKPSEVSDTVQAFWKCYGREL